MTVQFSPAAGRDRFVGSAISRSPAGIRCGVETLIAGAGASMGLPVEVPPARPARQYTIQALYICFAYTIHVLYMYTLTVVPPRTRESPLYTLQLMPKCKV